MADELPIELEGMEALQMAREISKVPGMTFSMAFYPYSRTKGQSSARLKVEEGCTVRAQLPDDLFTIDSDNLLLYNNSDGEPRMCYRVLIRFMSFPQDGYIMHKIKWFPNEREN